MRIVKIIMSVLLAMPMVVSCSRCSATMSSLSPKAEHQDVVSGQDVVLKAKPITGYFLKNTYSLARDTAFIVFQNRSSFDNAMGMARTMGLKPAEPDFTNDFVVAIALRPTVVQTDIILGKIEKVGDHDIFIHFELRKGNPLSYSMQPVMLFGFQKSENINGISFVSGGNIIQTIVVNRRSEATPKSTSDLLDNYTGHFLGTFPCADCSGIDVSLTLNRDYTYVLQRIYRGQGDGTPLVEKGKWTPSEDLTFVELGYDGKTDKSYYAFVDHNTLVKLDNEGKSIDSRLDYRLRRE